MLHKLILCFFMKKDIFSALIVQYYCRHGLPCLSESPVMLKLVVVPRTFYDTKGENTQSKGYLSTANNWYGNQEKS